MHWYRWLASGHVILNQWLDARSQINDQIFFCCCCCCCCCGARMWLEYRFDCFSFLIRNWLSPVSIDIFSINTNEKERKTYRRRMDSCFLRSDIKGSIFIIFIISNHVSFDTCCCSLFDIIWNKEFDKEILISAIRDWFSAFHFYTELWPFNYSSVERRSFSLDTLKRFSEISMRDVYVFWNWFSNRHLSILINWFVSFDGLWLLCWFLATWFTPFVNHICKWCELVGRSHALIHEINIEMLNCYADAAVNRSLQPNIFKFIFINRIFISFLFIFCVLVSLCFCRIATL